MLCAASAAAASDSYLVRRVPDGDTLVLENGQKVRLIGVDTPEMSDTSRNRDTARRNKLDATIVDGYAQLAKDFARELVEGKQVRLEYDWQREDKYGRVLAYVYRQEDGLFVNAEIIRQGYGVPIVYFPFRYKKDFELMRDQARTQKRGFWKNKPSA